MVDLVFLHAFMYSLCVHYMYVLIYLHYAPVLYAEPNFDLMMSESSSQVSSTDGNSPQPSPRITRQEIPIPEFRDEPFVSLHACLPSVSPRTCTPRHLLPMCIKFDGRHTSTTALFMSLNLFNYQSVC